MANKNVNELSEVPETIVSKVVINYKNETLGIGTVKPLISWVTQTDINAWVQSSYEIELYSEDNKLLDQTGKNHLPGIKLYCVAL